MGTEYLGTVCPGDQKSGDRMSGEICPLVPEVGDRKSGDQFFNNFMYSICVSSEQSCQVSSKIVCIEKCNCECHNLLITGTFQNLDKRI